MIAAGIPRHLHWKQGRCGLVSFSVHSPGTGHRVVMHGTGWGADLRRSGPLRYRRPMPLIPPGSAGKRCTLVLRRTTTRTLAQRYVQEGLRMDDHPLIRFADGPAGRRARLTGTGKDVWEVIAVVRDNGGDAAAAARYLEIPLGLVQAAVSYYGAYTAEVDQQIEANEQEAAEAHAAYLAGQAALGR
jgi:uncharacterized protein (DUF433 family)